ncbi:MAG: polysaccharide pyruvyl transferase family protein [Planctomycetota bacterium]|jgi:hypothetical protein
MSIEMKSRVKEFAKRFATIMWQGMQGKPPRVAYVAGWRGNQNLGDEVLYESMKELFYRCSFIEYTGGHAQYLPARIFPIVQYAVLAGGTLINHLKMWRDVASECIKICPNFFVFGAGVRHPSFWVNRAGWINSLDLWKPVLQRCKYVGVRGPMSAELLTDIGVKGVEVIGDPVLVYAKDVFEDDTSGIPNSIGLNIGQSYGNIWGSEEEVYTEYVKLAMILKKNGWKVKWFVVWPDDLAITQKAANISGTTDYIYEVYEDHNEYLRLVRPLSVFVGMKLHSVVLSTCAYVPSIMLEYRPKCRDFMKSIGQDAWTFRTDEFRAEEVWEIAVDWNFRRKEVSKALFDSIEPLKNKQHKKAEQLMMVMGVS